MRYILTLLFFAFFNFAYATTYYIRPTGNNGANGTSPTTAWKDLTNVNSKAFIAGDIVYLQQGNTYSGQIYFDASDGGTAASPVLITSWNPGGSITSRATINSGNKTGFYAYNSSGIKITDIDFIGTSSTNSGVVFYCDLPNNVKKDYIYLNNADVQGYKSGLSLGSWNNSCGYSNVTIRNSSFHDNISGGIGTYAQSRLSHTNVNVSYCKAYNNFGDLSNTTNNTGSGIVLSGIDGGKIDHSIAHNNGKNNRHAGGGPVGIWCYEANNIIIEYNESYGNEAGLDLDGGGFDIDGGSTNSIMQYNYSHDNDGAGYLFAQFSGSSVTMNNNICRYNLSVNDGRKNNSGAINFWAAVGHSITNTYVYGNTIYMTPSANGNAYGIYIYPGTTTTNTNFNNNLIVTTGGVKVIQALSTTGIQLKGNGYWSSGGTFAINWGGADYGSLSAFKTTGQESGAGVEANPLLNNPGAAITLNNTDKLSTVTAYQLKNNSPMIDAGIELTNAGLRDYYGYTIPLNAKYDIGAHEYSTPTNPITEIENAVENPVSIAPNPASNYLQIELSKIYPNSSLIVYGQDGKVMDELQNLERSVVLNTNNYPSGLYCLHLVLEGRIYKKKFSLVK